MVAASTSDDIEGALTITNTSISGNTAAVEGGGFYADYVLGAINITGATINNNTAGSGGGGAYFDEAHGGVTISNSTISGNSSRQQRWRPLRRLLLRGLHHPEHDHLGEHRG